MAAIFCPDKLRVLFHPDKIWQTRTKYGSHYDVRRTNYGSHILSGQNTAAIICPPDIFLVGHFIA